MATKNTKRVLLGVTGSVAAIKVPELVRHFSELQDPKVEVQVVATNAACHFFDPSSLPVMCHRDEDEWVWSKKGDPVLHIELRKWADLMVIAPLDANTMAKMSNGICDNLLTCLVRAWDPARPLLYCPAMNTFMWEHPFTTTQLITLTELNYIQVSPVSKKLACGDEGLGAMAHIPQIVEAVLKFLQLPKMKERAT